MNEFAARLPLAAAIRATELRLFGMRFVATEKIRPSFYAQLLTDNGGNLRIWADDLFEANFIRPLSQKVSLAELPQPLRQEVLIAAALRVITAAPLRLHKITAESVPPLAEDCQFLRLEDEEKTLLGLAAVADDVAAAALKAFLPPPVLRHRAVTVPVVISDGRAQLRVEELRSLAVGDFVFYRPERSRAIIGSKQFIAAIGKNRLRLTAEPRAPLPSALPTLEVETARVSISAARLASLRNGEAIAFNPNAAAALSLQAETIAVGQLRQIGGRHAFYVTARSPKKLQYQTG